MGIKNPKFTGEPTQRSVKFLKLKMGEVHEDKASGKVYIGWDDRSTRCLSDMDIKTLAEADAQFAYLEERYGLLRKQVNVMVVARQHAAQAVSLEQFSAEIIDPDVQQEA